MYWRNRLQRLTKEPIYSKHHEPSTHITESGKITFSPYRDFDDEWLINDDIFPKIIVIQGTVKPSFYENENTFVKATKDSTPYCLYSKTVPTIQKALLTLEIIFDNFIPEAGTSFEWTDYLNKKNCLFKKDFEVLKEGNYLWEEKRSPQEGIPEQSLWSYGGNYNGDFDICQVYQSLFFPVNVNGKTTIRSYKSKKSFSILDFIQNGDLKIFQNDENKNFYYQSFFIKSLSSTKVHIHLKKINLDQKETF